MKPISCEELIKSWDICIYGIDKRESSFVIVITGWNNPIPTKTDKLKQKQKQKVG